MKKKKNKKKRKEKTKPGGHLHLPTAVNISGFDPPPP
jgi:hypothetical protein